MAGIKTMEDPRQGVNTIFHTIWSTRPELADTMLSKMVMLKTPEDVERLLGAAQDCNSNAAKQLEKIVRDVSCTWEFDKHWLTVSLAGDVDGRKQHERLWSQRA